MVLFIGIGITVTFLLRIKLQLSGSQNHGYQVGVLPIFFRYSFQLRYFRKCVSRHGNDRCSGIVDMEAFFLFLCFHSPDYSIIDSQVLPLPVSKNYFTPICLSLSNMQEALLVPKFRIYPLNIPSHPYGDPKGQRQSQASWQLHVKIFLPWRDCPYTSCMGTSWKDICPPSIASLA